MRRRRSTLRFIRHLLENHLWCESCLGTAMSSEALDPRGGSQWWTEGMRHPAQNANAPVGIRSECGSQRQEAALTREDGCDYRSQTSALQGFDGGACRV